MLGVKVRLRRLMSRKEDKFLGVMIDHGPAYLGWEGLENPKAVIGKAIEGGADAITMHKGIAEKCFLEFAGRIALIVKCSTFSPFHHNLDVQVAKVEEAVRLGADAVSIGVILGTERQPEMLRSLGELTREARLYDMPVIAHIYPRGEMVEKETTLENIRYALRLGAELGVDLIKTHYTGDPESFSKALEATPAMVVVAGGIKTSSDEELLGRTKEIMEAGATGVAYGRNIWQHENPVGIIRALSKIIH